MTGFSIYQSTSKKLRTIFPLTKEVVADASKITPASSFPVFWGFTVYGWFCASLFYCSMVWKCECAQAWTYRHRLNQ